MEIESCSLNPQEKGIRLFSLLLMSTVAMTITADNQESPISEIQYEDERFPLFWNESGIENLDCEEFNELDQPPKWEDLPPPPLPPFLDELGLLFQESWRKRALILSYPEEHIDLEELNEVYDLPEEGECPLCSWSRGNNDTLEKLERKPVGQTKDKESTSAMVWALVAVAAVSASIGAIIMGVLLRCRRKDVINICAKSENGRNENPQSATALTDEKRNKCPVFCLFFKRRQERSPQTSLDPPYRAESVQNTYSESPYINGDSSSTLYAEINSPVPESTTSSSHCCSNVFSISPDPFISAGGLNAHYRKTPSLHSASKGLYMNNAYVNSEESSEPNESSSGSTSTPSSAYYSDVSAAAVVHNSKKKKKKRKFEDRNTRVRFAQSVKLEECPPPTIGKGGDCPPLSVQTQGGNCIYPNPHALPEYEISSPQFYNPNSFQFGNAEILRGQEAAGGQASGIPSCNHGQNVVPTISVINSRLFLHPLTNDCGQTQSNIVQTIPVCPHFQAVYSGQNEETSRQWRANETLHQWTLPSLPSRQQQGPQRRMHSGTDLNVIKPKLSAVPSEYV